MASPNFPASERSFAVFINARDTDSFAMVYYLQGAWEFPHKPPRRVKAWVCQPSDGVQDPMGHVSFREKRQRLAASRPVQQGHPVRVSAETGARLCHIVG